MNASSLLDDTIALDRIPVSAVLEPGDAHLAVSDRPDVVIDLVVLLQEPQRTSNAFDRLNVPPLGAAQKLSDASR